MISITNNYSEVIIPLALSATFWLGRKFVNFIQRCDINTLSRSDWIIVRTIPKIYRAIVPPNSSREAVLTGEIPDNIFFALGLSMWHIYYIPKDDLGLIPIICGVALETSAICVLANCTRIVMYYTFPHPINIILGPTNFKGINIPMKIEFK